MYSTMYIMYFIERLSSRRHSYERRLHAVLNMKPQRRAVAQKLRANKGVWAVRNEHALPIPAGVLFFSSLGKF